MYYHSSRPICAVCSRPLTLAALRRNVHDQTAKSVRKLKPLSRPVGVPAADATTNQSAKQAEVNTAKRKVLLNELQKSYFADFAAVKDGSGGKAFIGPSTLIKSDRALYFPKMRGRTLSSKEEKSTAQLFPGKISLVAIESTQLSAEHIQSFAPALRKDQANESLFQVITINLQENYLKSLLVNLFVANLRKQVPPTEYDKYLVVSQNMELLRGPLLMENKHLGYVYLVDADGRIRWAGMGFAQDEELLGLRSCTAVLLERLKQGSSIKSNGN